MHNFNNISSYWKDEGSKYKLPHFRLHFIFDLITNHILTSKKILDIGGGPGALKNMLTPLGYDVFVLDLTSDLKKDVLLHDLNQHLSVNKIPKKFLSPSVVVVSGLLEYLEDWKNTLDIIKATSDQSTICILSYINSHHPQAKNKKKFHPLWTNIRTPSEVEKTLIASGFLINKTYGVTPATRFTKIFGHNNYFSLLLKWPLMQTLFGNFVFRQYVWIINLNENSTHISSYR